MLFILLVYILEMKYHNVNGVQVELKKARTKSELITGNFAGEVRNTNDIAQQLTQYNNLSYSQVYIVYFSIVSV